MRDIGFIVFGIVIALAAFYFFGTGIMAGASLTPAQADTVTITDLPAGPKLAGPSPFFLDPSFLAPARRFDAPLGTDIVFGR